MPDSFNRRSILKGAAATGAAGIAGSALAAPQAATRPAAPAISRNLPDVVVIGSGAFGGWSALSLLEAGYKTTMVDLYGPGNPHASSGGESRNIRSGYGDREIYSDWAAQAWVAWHQRQEEFGRKLIYPSSSLRDPGPGQMDAQIAVYDKLGLPYEMLTPEEVNRRWPAIRYDDVDRVFFDTQSGSVKARESMIAVAEVFEQKGGEFVLGNARPGIGTGGRMDSVNVNGEQLSAGQFVFALGPWLGKVFPEFMGNMLRIRRSELFYIAPEAGNYDYMWFNMPGCSDRAGYTTADIGGGYKIGAGRTNATIDPDDGSRLPSISLLDHVRDYIALRLPGLAGRPVLQSYVCQTCGTDTGHYIFDTHPDFGNVYLAGGGSGHAFKMGPVLGDYVRDRVAGIPMPEEHQAIFPLSAHGPIEALGEEPVTAS